jgi:putative N6-adenine-specific DNA methylase
VRRGGELEVFLATAPGLEEALLEEVRGKGFRRPKAIPGGVVVHGGWPDAWRANLWVRGAGARAGAHRPLPRDHLSLLERRAREVPWAELLRPELPFRVEASCASSRIYHSGAAEERIATAITGRSARRSRPTPRSR